ncbi:MAG: hypothetical protein LBD71_02985 [Treponema sp.]|jgi:hypothetical protein|nr:hypothetical protein [Treponema sp.]
MNDIKPCLCGAMPAVERKTVVTDYEEELPVEKWKCPRCAEKELPFLDAREWGEKGEGSSCLRAWNRIADEPDYRRRTLKYNEHGVCVDEPYKTYEWRDKKRFSNHVTAIFYLDNGMYYYCYDYWYKDGGAGRGLWIGDPCFPSMAAAKKHAAKKLSGKRREIAGIAKELLLDPAQKELF